MTYDVVVIGGGPAGMMAAGQAGKKGARVLLIEKNGRPGQKLLTTGHGRCNLTNLAADSKATIGVYGPGGKFLLSPFHRFGVDHTLDFFAALGVATKVEDQGRVFPQSDSALEVRQALIGYLEKCGVEVRTGTAVKEVLARGKKIEKIVLANGVDVRGRNFIIAAGGSSYPETGSTGDAYGWLAGLGHKVIPPRPALTPVTVKEEYVKELEGLSLSDVAISVRQARKKIIEIRGDLIFTADGVSGPAIIDLSGRIGALLPKAVTIVLDLLPDISASDLDRKLQKDLHHGGNRIIKNQLTFLVPPKITPVILRMADMDGERPANTVTKEERRALLCALKEFTLEVDRLKDFDKAMVTAGGAALGEVDPKTMRSRLYDNLFLAGEILDLDGPTGGYNLQICWSTGFAAGDSAAP